MTPPGTGRQSISHGHQTLHIPVTSMCAWCAEDGEGSGQANNAYWLSGPRSCCGGKSERMSPRMPLKRLYCYRPVDMVFSPEISERSHTCLQVEVLKHYRRLICGVTYMRVYMVCLNKHSKFLNSRIGFGSNRIVTIWFNPKFWMFAQH